MTTTQDEKALLRAIFENPDDDAPRLIYADAIQELGRDADAESIREAVSNPRQSTPMYLPLYKNPSYRIFERDAVVDMRSSIQYCKAYARRGFLDEVDINHDDFMKNFERIFSQFPIRHVRITDRMPFMSCWYSETYRVPYDLMHVPHIHKAIFDSLPMKSNKHPDCEHYDASMNAYEILSQACVALGRHSASLPMMPNYRYRR